MKKQACVAGIGLSTAVCVVVGVVVGLGSRAMAGPYSTATSNWANAIDPGVPGFVGTAGEGVVSSNNIVNPIFAGWADGVASYEKTGQAQGTLPGEPVGDWGNPTKALGAVTGSNFDIVSLGDLDAESLASGLPSGRITLSFSTPIVNGGGADFAVFENGFANGAKMVSAELAYVEVSSNGTDFVRFQSVSLTTETDMPTDEEESPETGNVWGYATIDVTNITGLAGKHANNGRSFGTAFDLQSLANTAAVTSGSVDLNNIRYVRIVDVVGCPSTLTGAATYNDTATQMINPNTGTAYTANHKIFDQWLTYGSGGFDLEAIGVINNAATSATTIRNVAMGAQASVLAGGSYTYQWNDTAGNVTVAFDDVTTGGTMKLSTVAASTLTTLPEGTLLGGWKINLNTVAFANDGGMVLTLPYDVNTVAPGVFTVWSLVNGTWTPMSIASSGSGFVTTNLLSDPMIDAPIYALMWAVPEPMTIALMIAGSTIAMRRRR